MHAPTNQPKHSVKCWPAKSWPAFHNKSKFVTVIDTYIHIARGYESYSSVVAPKLTPEAILFGAGGSKHFIVWRGIGWIDWVFNSSFSYIHRIFFKIIIQDNISLNHENFPDFCFVLCVCHRNIPIMHKQKQTKKIMNKKFKLSIQFSHKRWREKER